MKNNQLDSKPKNQFTNVIAQLLDWLSHLELSGDHLGEQDVGQLLSMPAYSDSIYTKIN